MDFNLEIQNWSLVHSNQITNEVKGGQREKKKKKTLKYIHHTD